MLDMVKDNDERNGALKPTVGGDYSVLLVTAWFNPIGTGTVMNRKYVKPAGDW